MSYFIKALDEEAEKEKKRYDYIFKNIVIQNGKLKNENFILRKGTSSKDNKTRILYVKDGARVRFTDNDILYMIMQIDDSTIVNDILRKLKYIYTNGILYSVTINEETVYINISEQVNHCQIFDNYKDIPLSYEDLIYLIDLVLIKDIDANTSVEGKIVQYHKRTLCKYISVIENYMLKNEGIINFFQEAGIKSTGDFWIDFQVGDNAKDNQRNSINFYCFEKLMFI